MSKKKWCWGILSTANIGRTRFIPALQSISNVEVVAVASRNLQKAEIFAGECGIAEAYGSYQELLEHPDIDILYNPTPNLHVSLSIKALEHGKHVLCEKPIALTTHELDQLIQAMQQAIEKHHPLPITLEDSMETMAIIDRLFYPKNNDFRSDTL